MVLKGFIVQMRNSGRMVSPIYFKEETNTKVRGTRMAYSIAWKNSNFNSNGIFLTRIIDGVEHNNWIVSALLAIALCVSFSATFRYGSFFKIAQEQFRQPSLFTWKHERISYWTGKPLIIFALKLIPQCCCL